MAAATNFLPTLPLERNTMAVGSEFEIRKIFKAPTVYGNISKGIGSLSKILASDLGLASITTIIIDGSVSGTYQCVPLSKNQKNGRKSVEVLVKATANGAEVTDETDLSAERFLVIARGNH